MELLARTVAAVWGQVEEHVPTAQAPSMEASRLEDSIPMTRAVSMEADARRMMMRMQVHLASNSEDANARMRAHSASGRDLSGMRRDGANGTSRHAHAHASHLHTHTHTHILIPLALSTCKRTCRVPAFIFTRAPKRADFPRERCARMSSKQYAVSSK